MRDEREIYRQLHPDEIEAQRRELRALMPDELKGLPERTEDLMDAAKRLARVTTMSVAEAASKLASVFSTCENMSKLSDMAEPPKQPIYKNRAARRAEKRGRA